MGRWQLLAWSHRHRWEIPFLLLASSGLLFAGLMLPIFETKKLFLWKDEYSIWTGVVNLYKEEHFVLAALIFVFSILFPVLKLIALSLMWMFPFSIKSRKKLLHRIKVLSKWSMLDVFVVAVIIVVTQTGGIVEATPRPGLYIFAGAILLSMVVTIMIDRVTTHER